MTIYEDGIRPSSIAVQSFHPDKMLRVGEIQAKAELIAGYGSPISERFINVCGIFMGFIKIAKADNENLVVGKLCDPISEKSINFSFFENLILPKT